MSFKPSHEQRDSLPLETPSTACGSARVSPSAIGAPKSSYEIANAHTLTVTRVSHAPGWQAADARAVRQSRVAGVSTFGQGNGDAVVAEGQGPLLDRRRVELGSCDGLPDDLMMR